MLPLELKCDKNGLLYMEDRKVLKRASLLLDKRNVSNRYYQNSFYRIDSTDDYIIKYSCNPFLKEDRKKMMIMLENLVAKQSQVPNVDFPIGYFRQWHKLRGLIVRYYQNGVSVDNIIQADDIKSLEKYYCYDADNIHNLFLLLQNMLDVVYEMFENGIYYTDINPGNFILVDNQVKVIDFDSRFVFFENADKDRSLFNIMYNYEMLLRRFLAAYDLYYDCLDEMFSNFEEAKVFTKKVENTIYKR